MLIWYARLLFALAFLLSACTSPSKRPESPVGPEVWPNNDVVRESPRKPSVVTVPIDTGLETVPNTNENTPPTQNLPEERPVPDHSRAPDAASSPYPASGELSASHSALPAMEAVTEPSLSGLEYPVPPSPEPEVIRTLTPRIGERLFIQTAPAAVAALERDIESHFTARRYGDAAAQIDRALRIQPKNAELWHVLAEIRLRQNQPGLAEDLAKKSNTLAKSNAELIKSNWRLISDARRQQGDGPGAQDALEKAW